MDAVRGRRHGKRPSSPPARPLAPCTRTVCRGCACLFGGLCMFGALQAAEGGQLLEQPCRRCPASRPCRLSTSPTYAFTGHATNSLLSPHRAASPSPLPTRTNNPHRPHPPTHPPTPPRSCSTCRASRACCSALTPASRWPSRTTSGGGLGLGAGLGLRNGECKGVRGSAVKNGWCRGDDWGGCVQRV